MKSNNYNARSTIWFLLLLLLKGKYVIAFVPPILSSSHPQDSSLVFYKDEQKIEARCDSMSSPINDTKGKRAIVEKIQSLAEMQYFLEGDDRLAAIKFYAPWCKTCQRLGKSFNRLALDMGDGIVNRQRVGGQIRCAEVQCSSPNSFVAEQLYVMALPTLQLYYGMHKVWESTGQTSTKELRNICSKFQCLSPEELQSHAESTDDGVLLNALEDTLYNNYPSFLDEEW